MNTRFPIDGKHIKLDCNACHVPKEKKKGLTIPLNVGTYHWDKLDRDTCEVCHESPHKKDPKSSFRQKKCSECHSAEGWNIFNKNGKRFNHDTTRFKLTGRHAQITCSACHVVA